jgi:hypothetical protein
MERIKKYFLMFHVLVKDLILSGEHVVRHRGLFLHAIEWYHEKVSQEKWDKWSTNELSLLPRLKVQVDDGKSVNGPMGTLLSALLKEYWEFLEEFREKPWADKEAVDREIAELDSIVRDNLLKIGSADRSTS